MPLKFAANLSTTFLDRKALPQRYFAAKKAGFKGVECQFPYDCPAQDLARAREDTGVTHVLLNSHKGKCQDVFGLALASEEEFMESLDITLNYAKALKAKCVHVIAGLSNNTGSISYYSNEEKERNYINNLKRAAHEFEKCGIIGVIEPLCKEVKPDYFLNNFSQAIDVLNKVNSENMKLLLDIFHLQMIHGNLTNNIKAYLPYTGHVQIAQAPKRNRPNLPGEINYKYILSLLGDAKYDGWIGLEYFPEDYPEKSFLWMKEYGYHL